MSRLALRLMLPEEVGVRRDGEVVTAGVALPTGALADEHRFAISDARGSPVPVQVLRVGRWPDGGVRWMSLAFPASVCGGGTELYTLSDSNAPAVAPDTRVLLTPEPGGIRVDTGTIAFSIRADPLDPLVGFPGVQSARIRLKDQQRTHHVAVGRDVMIEHEGPLLATVLVTGTLAADTSCNLSFECRVTATAGASHVDIAVQVICDAQASEVEISSWTFDISTDPVRTGVCGVFDAAQRGEPPFTIAPTVGGHTRGIFATSQVVAGEHWADVRNVDAAQRWQWAELHGRVASNWVAAESDGSCTTVAVRRFAENSPGELALGAGGVTARLWPEQGEPLVLAQGMAKTRAIRILAGEDRHAGLVLDSPVVPFQLDGEDAHGLRVLPYLPETYPNLEAHIREELFGWYQSGQALGFLDFGDSMQGIITGPRTGYSANNEHDALLALVLHYLRSGERAYYDSAEAYADHLCDVDFVHHTTANDFEHGGLRAHGRGHVHYQEALTATGPVMTSIDTGHLWTEGLVLFSQVSGQIRYLDAATRVAECITRLVDLGWARPEPGPRNSGWPLIGLTAVARATGEQRYLDAARTVARQALAAQDADGRWTMRIGLREDYCAWQNAVLLVGLARFLELENDSLVRKSFRSGSEAMIDIGRNRDGTFIYLTRFDYRWANRSALIREALALACDASGDERFVTAGLTGGNRWYRAAGAPAALSNDIAEWRGHLQFLARAHDIGLLSDMVAA